MTPIAPHITAFFQKRLAVKAGMHTVSVAFLKKSSATTLELLQPFERVARVRAVLSQNDFRKWLHLANDQLDGRTPLEAIRHGKVAVVADLVEDMLTGSPS